MTTASSSMVYRSFSKVLVANRGEIAVRIIRAAQDEGLEAVAIYANPDREAMHVRLADHAFSLNGDTVADTYLSVDKVLRAAKDADADAIHPGYGFLAENAEFAQAVIDAGIVWIGPPPAAIHALGDKVAARHIAHKVGAPLAPGTPDPVESSQDVIDFADEFGLPLAIKAAHGGGGRGIKVVRQRSEIPDAYDSAVREATAAFGRGECFVERFLDAPRHLETQCLADQAGNVVVVSTRDCSLQRRNQKLVEEAPAPFLTEDQEQQLYDASVALLQEAGYVGAGTCEFLIGQDGTISFLEVNTRLQVEHTVSEEVTGIDLVREQFRIARGELLGYKHPTVDGHSFEFRITAEDPGQNFMPAPGTITKMRLPGGPGVRIDTGIEEGETISGAFDSMVAKLIVTGKNRKEALQRSHRALTEMRIAGLATVLPFHRRVIQDPNFAPELEQPGQRLPADGPFTVHTRWIETDFINDLQPQVTQPAMDAEDEQQRRAVTVEVNGKRVEVTLPDSLASISAVESKPKRRRTSRSATGASGANAAGASGDVVTSPMQGTIVKMGAAVGDEVSVGDLILVLEAMKMEQPITAHKAGKITELTAEPGATVNAGAALATIEG
ncbi:acetyl/propionyl/methylcrotonyl-CoA carboxylase subunit alpha [Yaniella halotolerans]|uniref:acetyl/propionyl/methylcrotonyl-CoA carboxylase subunit alpha n=1 Tax=Yaniella halotolerans TaxID=225453 RepID=UPI0004977F0B